MKINWTTPEPTIYFHQLLHWKNKTPLVCSFAVKGQSVYLEMRNRWKTRIETCVWPKLLSVMVGLHCKHPSDAVESIAHFDQSRIDSTSGTILQMSRSSLFPPQLFSLLLSKHYLMGPFLFCSLLDWLVAYMHVLHIHSKLFIMDLNFNLG